MYSYEKLPIYIKEWFKANYTIDIIRLKNKIARQCIDFSTIKGNKTDSLLVTLSRYNDIMVSYHKYGFYNTNKDRYHYWFSTYHYQELPSGSNLGWETAKGIEILNSQYKVSGYISRRVARNKLTKDLIEHNYKHFNDLFEEFLKDLYNWNHEVD